MGKAIDPGQVYKVMHCAYRHGVLQKFAVLQGRMLETVMEEAGVNMGDLLNLLDDAGEDSVKRTDRLIGAMAPFVRFAASDRLMKLASRLLDMPAVQGAIITFLKKPILRNLGAEVKPPLAQRLKALAGRTA